jgi:tetratricopeptide (TPR) repeat protein
MAIRVACSCGKTFLYSDTLSDRTVPCRACRQPLLIQGAAIAPPKVSPVRRYLPIALVLLVPLTVGIVIVRSWTHPRFTPVLEDYRGGSKEAAIPETDRPRVEETLARLVKASADDNPEHFAWCFNVRRMLAEIEQRGGLDAIGLKWEETSLLDELDGSIRHFCEGQRLNGGTWHFLQRCTVRFIENRGEAEAFAAVRSAGSLMRFRFWLIKEKNEWGIYDFESLETGIRESTNQARALRKSRDGSAAQRARAEGLLEKAGQWIARGNFEEALESLNTAEPLSGKTELLPTIEMLQSVALFRLGRPEEALHKIDQTLEHRKDMPLAHHLRGCLLYSFGRFEECIRAQEEYLRVIGDDAPAWMWIGMSYEKMNNPEKAADAYRKGAAADEQDTANRTRLKALQESSK